MNIQDIVDYCDGLYRENQYNHACKRCNNHCKGSCERCLDSIHYGDDRRYNCDNIVNYYLCKYIYKYSSEIKYLFKTHRALKALDTIKVLSIGCGPCTDLFGILEFINNNEKVRHLEYTGIDLNNKWEHIHRYISLENSESINAKFIYDDVFNVINSARFKEEIIPNIIIFQYVLSDIIKYNNDIEIKDFIDKLIADIIVNLEDDSFIIFNDINYKDTRKYFDYMLNKINSTAISGQFVKHHFKHNKKSYYRYGRAYECNDVLFDIPKSILDNYNPWNFCSSSQLIIRKKVLE